MGTVNRVSGEAGEEHKTVGPRRERSWKDSTKAAVGWGRAGEKEPWRPQTLSIDTGMGKHLLLAALAHRQDAPMPWACTWACRADQEVSQTFTGRGELRKLGLPILRDLGVLAVTATPRC